MTLTCVAPYQTAGYKFPCRKCIVCLAKRKKQHVFRIREMHRKSMNSVFLTLTYANEHLPREESLVVNSQGELKYIPNPKGRPTLVKNHLATFLKHIKQFCRRAGQDNLRFYAVGEYGSQFTRPHYHIILMNFPEELIKRLTQERAKGLGNYHTELWKYGHINVSKRARRGSIDYVSKYVIGKAYGNVPVKPFFKATQGFGKEYLENQEVVSWHRQDGAIEDMHYYAVDRERYTTQPMPDYYRRKIFHPLERQHLAQITITEFERKQINYMEKLVEEYNGDASKALSTIQARQDHMIKMLQRKYLESLSL